MLDFVGAPGYFLMGVNGRHKETISETEGLVVVDIDEGTVEICQSLDLPSLPDEVAQDFKTTYTNIIKNQNQQPVISPDKPSPLSYEDFKKTIAKNENEVNQKIQNIFLDLMVDLFRDVSQFCHPNENLFKKSKFLECKGEKPTRDASQASQFSQASGFFTTVCETDLFKKFLNDRLKEKKDYWTERHQLTDVHGVRNPSKNKSSSLQKLSSSNAPLYPLLSRSPCLEEYTLPSQFDHKDLTSFYQFIKEELEGRLAVCANRTSLSASYYYLIGLLRVAIGLTHEGLATLNQLTAHDNRIYPKEIIEKIIRLLNKDERNKLKNKYQSKQLQAIIANIEKTSDSGHHHHVIMEFDEIPQNDVDIIHFQQCIRRLQLGLIDIDTIESLFASLTIGQNHLHAKVQSQTFSDFYDCWKDNEIKCEEIREIPGIELDPNEDILKVSSSITTNFGVGQLGFTQRSVFFIKQGCSGFEYKVKFTEIEDIQKMSYFSVLSRNSDTLNITNKGEINGKKIFIAYLSTDRNLWYMLIDEMWKGKQWADKTREPGVVQQAAQNVLLLDAVVRSLQDNCGQKAQEGANMLAYFRNIFDNGIHGLNKNKNFGSQKLVHRINPNEKEPEKQTIESLLYTSGYACDGSDETEMPKLWCGMGRGKVRVFDASSWKLFDSTVNAIDRVLCLMKVGQNVWAGSRDHIIYVIDIKTRQCNQKLEGHTDMVCDMTMSTDGKIAYSASLSGEIIVWNTTNFSKVNNFILKTVSAICCHDGLLWCCANNKRTIVAVNQCNGGLMVSHSYNNREFDCFLISSTNELWVGFKHIGEVCIWNINNLNKVPLRTIKVTSRGINCMIQVGNRIWAGGKSSTVSSSRLQETEKQPLKDKDNTTSSTVALSVAKLHIIETREYTVKDIEAHGDSIRCMCTAENRYVLTGAGSRDGRVAIWRANDTIQEGATIINYF